MIRYRKVCNIQEGDYVVCRLLSSYNIISLGERPHIIIYLYIRPISNYNAGTQYSVSLNPGNERPFILYRCFANKNLKRYNKLNMN